MIDGIAVWVQAINYFGDIEEGYGFGSDADDAVEDALEIIRDRCGDDSFVMNEWEAA